jgi:hypothetical protein
MGMEDIAVASCRLQRAQQVLSFSAICDQFSTCSALRISGGYDANRSVSVLLRTNSCMPH